MSCKSHLAKGPAGTGQALQQQALWRLTERDWITAITAYLAEREEREKDGGAEYTIRDLTISTTLKF